MSWGNNWAIDSLLKTSHDSSPKPSSTRTQEIVDLQKTLAQKDTLLQLHLLPQSLGDNKQGENSRLVLSHLLSLLEDQLLTDTSTLYDEVERGNHRSM